MAEHSTDPPSAPAADRRGHPGGHDAALIARVNNLDAIRLIAAITVIIGHGYVLTSGTDAPRMFGIPVHTLAVAVFFSVSGFLIPRSAARVPVREFAWHRFLRIWPALALVVTVSVLVVGPLFTSLSAGEYFRDSETWGYFQNLTTAAVYELPGVFEGHRNSAVNGSLWTLGVEVVCYVLVALVHGAFGRIASPAYVGLAVVLAALSLTLATPDGVLSALADAAPVMVYFFVAAAVSASGGRAFLKPSVGVFILIAWSTLSGVFDGRATELSWVFLPYCVLTFGLESTPGVRRVGRFGDFSYGIYLWGFPVQQMLIDLAPGLRLASNNAAVLAMTVLIAIGSWKFVEAPALRVKHRRLRDRGGRSNGARGR